MKRDVKLVILFSFFLVFLINCEKKPNEIKIGYIPITLDLPFFTAVEKGYFKELGLNIIPIKFVTSNPMAEALVGGQIDVMTSCGLEVVYALEQGLPGTQKIFLAQINTKNKYIDYILIKENSSIKNVSDLKNKKIGTFPGSTILTYTKIILKKFGINPEKDVNIIQISPQLQIEALSSGQIDALFALEPIGTIAINKKIAKPLIIGPLYYIMDPLPGGAYVFTDKFFKNNFDKANKIINAMNKAVDYIRSNEKEVKEFLPKWTSITEDLAYSINIIPYWKLNEINQVAMQKLADLLYEHKIIEKKIDINNLILNIKI